MVRVSAFWRHAGLLSYLGERWSVHVEHPCPRKDEHMEWLVRFFTDRAEIILDPFAGSGTTGVAAIRLGRRFLGWKRDPKYHAAAMKRLQGTREQLTLDRPRVKAKQERLW